MQFRGCTLPRGSTCASFGDIAILVRCPNTRSILQGSSLPAEPRPVPPSTRWADLSSKTAGFHRAPGSLLLAPSFTRASYGRRALGSVSRMRRRRR